MRQRLIWSVVAIAAVIPAFGGTVSVNLGSASSFGLLGGTISNTGTSVVIGNVGATTTISGFYPTGTATGFVCTPTSAAPCTPGNDTAVTAAYSDFENAFNTAEADPSTQSFAGLTTSQTFLGNNVYLSTSSIVSSTTGINLTFDAQSNSNAVFIIQIPEALTVNGAMTFSLLNGAAADNIFWIVGTDATISVGSSGPITFDGNILAGDAFTMSAGSGGSGVLAGTINGCVFAENANTLAGQTDVGGCSNYSNGGGSVPEPGTLTLLSMGLGVSFLLRRKFRPVR
jgi:hypothetical protein